MARASGHLALVENSAYEASTGGSPEAGGPSGPEAPIENRSRVREERIRLFANFLNIVSAGALVAAFITEPLAFSANGNQMDSTSKAIFFALSIVASIVVHSIAQFVIGRIEN